MKIKINFSGHSVEGFEIAPLVGVNLPMETSDGLKSALQECFKSIPEEMRSLLEKGKVAEVILPGMAPASAVLLAEWHGRFGSFPVIRWAVRGPEGFNWPEEATTDLQTLREQARLRRVTGSPAIVPDLNILREQVLGEKP